MCVRACVCVCVCACMCVCVSWGNILPSCINGDLVTDCFVHAIDKPVVISGTTCALLSIEFSAGAVLVTHRRLGVEI